MSTINKAITVKYHSDNNNNSSVVPSTKSLKIYERIDQPITLKNIFLISSLTLNFVLFVVIAILFQQNKLYANNFITLLQKNITNLEQKVEQEKINQLTYNISKQDNSAFMQKKLLDLINNISKQVNFIKKQNKNNNLSLTQKVNEQNNKYTKENAQQQNKSIEIDLTKLRKATKNSAKQTNFKDSIQKSQQKIVKTEQIEKNKDVENIKNNKNILNANGKFESLPQPIKNALPISKIKGSLYNTNNNDSFFILGNKFYYVGDKVNQAITIDGINEQGINILFDGKIYFLNISNILNS